MNTEWFDWLTRYFMQMEAANRASGTIRLHRHYLNQLRKHFDSPTQVTTDDLIRLMAYSGWKPDAKKSARSVWRSFFKWAHGNALIDEWIGETIPSVTVPPRLPRPAPEYVVAAATQFNDRESLMCALAAYAGLRAAEIAQVWPDRDLRNDLLLVHGKGAKQRVVPIEDSALLEALKNIRGWAFPSTNPSQHLTPGHVTKLMSRALPDNWTAHPLRHRFATIALDGTDDLSAVSELLGHASVATTQIYTKVSVNKLRRAARAASRRAA